MIDNYYLIGALFFILLMGLFYMLYAWLTALGGLINIEEVIYRADKKTGFIKRVELVDEELGRELSNAFYQGKREQNGGKNEKIRGCVGDSLYLGLRLGLAGVCGVY